VTFLGAAGVRTLLSVRDAARQRGRTCCIVDASACVTRVVELLQLHQVFAPPDA
jgi:anti-anti-sigma regulatory factor